MTEPHPLALSSDWQKLTNHVDQTVTLLHKSGLFLRFTNKFLIENLEWGEATWGAVADALGVAVLAGATGEHVLTVSRQGSHRAWFNVAPVGAADGL